jgi:hypothetical protein
LNTVRRDAINEEKLGMLVNMLKTHWVEELEEQLIIVNSIVPLKTQRPPKPLNVPNPLPLV